MVDDHSLSMLGLSGHVKRCSKLELPRPALAPYADKLVSSQLSVQLSQNSGARGKGNWPSEVSRLQYLAGCPASWRCDMISKRATKSKLSTGKETAKARNLEICSSRGKGHAKVQGRETRRLRPRLSRHGTWPSLQSPQARANLHLLKSANRSTTPLRAEAGQPRQKRLRKLAAIIAPTYRFAQQWFHRRKNPSWEIITSRQCKQKTFTQIVNKQQMKRDEQTLAENYRSS
jgi:hypothetical protein